MRYASSAYVFANSRNAALIDGQSTPLSDVPNKHLVCSNDRLRTFVVLQFLFIIQQILSYE